MLHPTAIIHPSARLGANVSVGPFAIIEDGVELGDNCVLASHAILRRGTILGQGVKVDSLAVIGGDPQDLRFDPATPSGVRMGDGVTVREGAVVHRSTKPGGFTEVGPGSLLMGFCHLGHDCHLGARVLVGNVSLLAGHVCDVGDDCFLSGGTGFHQFIRIGEGSMVGGNGRMSLDVPPYTLCAERNELYGLNIVGLRRRKFDAATIAELRHLYKAVYQGGSPRKNAEAAASQATTVHGKKFLAFFAGGKRGFIRPPSTVKAEDSATENTEGTE